MDDQKENNEQRLKPIKEEKKKQKGWFYMFYAFYKNYIVGWNHELKEDKKKEKEERQILEKNSDIYNLIMLRYKNSITSALKLLSNSNNHMIWINE